MTVSFAVMAHPRRRHQAERLAAELGDAPIAWAQPPWAKKGDWTPIWRTRRAALRLHTDAPFHCIVQDDAILAPGFRERVEQLVTAGEYLYGLFFRKKRRYRGINVLADTAQASGSFVSRRGPILGVGLVFPVAWIDDLVTFGDRDPGTDGDDDRIRRWLHERGYSVCYPIPSLVDHQAGPSLIGNAAGRVAWRFEQAVA